MPLLTDDRLDAALQKAAEKYGWRRAPYVCGICGAKPNGKALAADHDHVTNKARGYLCSACNRGLGHFKDDPRLLRAAIRYLAKYKSVD